jgi:hypothetical protein
MAKRKHATALFEVIHSGDPAHRKLLSTPRWWFKKGSQAEQPASSAPVSSPPAARAATDENDPTAGRDAIDHHIRPASGASSSPAATATATTSTSAREVATVEYSSQPAASRAAGVDLAVDTERQQITFKISYTSAIVVTFAIVVAVGLAYLVGQKMSRGPSLAMGGQTSEQLRTGPKNPAVLDVGRNANAQQQAPREPETGISSRGPENNPDNVVAPPGVSADPGDANPQQQRRVLNLNYVVVQSYPDQKSAEEARDALIKAGIGATIERGLKGWTKDWYIVVGVQGFQRASGPDYEAYVRRINDVSTQFAQRKRSFKAFQPMAVKWQNAG